MPAQVAEPLLADGRRQQHGAVAAPADAGQVAAELDQRGDGDAVVADARAVQPSAVTARLERRAGREHGVEMRRDDDRGAGRADPREHVAGLVGEGLEAGLGQQRGDCGRALGTPRTSGAGMAQRARVSRTRSSSTAAAGSGAAPPRYAADSSRGAAMRVIAASLLVASSAATLYDSASVG